MSSRVKKPKTSAKPNSTPRRGGHGGGGARKPSSGGGQKRSQATARNMGGTRSGGHPEASKALADALRGGSRDEVIKNSLTHPFHTYPARMHPATARALVELCFEEGQASPRIVLDPFCGSGTTLVEARAMGVQAIGTDLNPLGLMVASAKSWTPSMQELLEFEELGMKLSARAFEEGKAARRAGYTPQPLRIPRGIDPALREEEVGAWFSPHVRRELEFLASGIDDLRDSNSLMADRLSVCLSSILIKCSKRTSDTSSKETKRNIARGAPARWFGERVQILVAGLRELYKLSKGASADVQCNDARTLKGIEDASVGAIVSSPPYTGTYDYVDHHRLRMAFLGIPYEEFAEKEIGARRFFKGRAEAARDEAFGDFRQCIDSFYRVLAPGGLMALMVGDSVAGVEAVWADELLRDLVGMRFQQIAWAWQERPKLGSLEKRAFGERAKREHLLLFEKR